MARNRKNAPPQVKHFQREDHAHAAHQEETTQAHKQKPDHAAKADAKTPSRKPGHPLEGTPRGPSRGQ